MIALKNIARPTLHNKIVGWLTSANILSYTKPTATEINAVNTFITGLDNAGLLSRMKTGNIYGFGSFGLGTLNIANPATYQHTVIGTAPTFTSGRGIKAAANSSAINTNFKVNETVGIENDLTTIVSVPENSEAGSAEVFGSNIITTSTATLYSLSTKTASVQEAARFNYHLNTKNYASANMGGLFFSVQQAGKSIVYKEGIKTEADVTTVTPNMSNNVFLLSRNKATTSGGSTPNTTPFAGYVNGFFRFDKFTQSEVETFTNLWNTFTQAVAVPTTYYVRPAGTTYGTGNGTSYANAWSGFSSIIWTNFKPWDILYVCGTNYETLNVKASRINVRGDYPSDPAIFDAQSIRDRNLMVENQSFVILDKLEFKNSVYDNMGFFGDCWGNVVNDCDSHHAGNEAYQNEGRVYVTYNRCKGRNCADDGMSLHNGAVVVANYCEFNDNMQGINAILSGKFTANNCNIHDNNQNIRPEGSQDFTINNSTITNGLIMGLSSIPLKLNYCTITNCTTSGSVTVTP